MLVQSATHGKHLDNIYSAEIYISVHEQSSAVLFLGLHRTEVAYLFTKDTDVNEQLSSQGLSIANSSNRHPPEWKYGHSVESHSGEDVLTTEQLMDIKEPVVLFYTILSIVCV